MDIKETQKKIYENSKKKGFYDNDIQRTFGDVCALFHSEITEAYEEYRNGHNLRKTYYNESKPTKPEGIPTELADVIIRILDTCEHEGIDIEEAIKRKMNYNATREYRHGGKKT